MYKNHHTNPQTNIIFVAIKEYYRSKCFRDFCTYLIKPISAKVHFSTYILLDSKCFQKAHTQTPHILPHHTHINPFHTKHNILKVTMLIKIIIQTTKQTFSLI